MNKLLILIWSIFPLTLLGQQLECCKSVEEVSTNINGYWEMKDSDRNEHLRFEFKNGIGKFWINKFNEKNELIESKKNEQTLEIYKTESGFELDWSNKNRLATSKIKVLNSKNLVFVRRDGKETEYYRITE